MKKNRAFSLIELLAVIIILGLVMTIAVGVVVNNNNKNKEVYYKSQIDNIILAGKDYFSHNVSLLPQNIGEVKEVSLAILIKDDYLKPLKDFNKNNCNVEDNTKSKVKVIKTGNSKYFYTVSWLCNGFKEETNTEKPIITFNPNKNTKGEQIKVIVNIKDTSSISYIGYTINKTDTTSEVILKPSETNFTIFLDKEGIYTITVRAINSKGNIVSVESPRYIIEEKKPLIMPTLIIEGKNPLDVSLNKTYIDPGYSAKDWRGINVSVTVSGSVNINVAGSYTLTYTAIDSYGGKTVKTRTVNVRNLPTLTLYGANPYSMEQGGNYYESGSNARDWNNKNLRVNISGNINPYQEGTYILIYSAIDSLGGKITKTRIVSVVGLSFTSESFSYTGNYQSFVIPKNGNYKLETWGAQGGTWSDCRASTSGEGGLGGYATGTKYFQANEVLYIYVGGQAQRSRGGFNGGGSNAIGGGGGTDFRTSAGSPLDYYSLQSRIVVAGGGGGARAREQSKYYNCMPGLSVGDPDSKCATTYQPGNFNGGNQGGFGYGSNGTTTSTTTLSSYSGAGGGGYYGGAGSNPKRGMGVGGAGSNYVSNNLFNISLINGNEGMPMHYGSGQMIGNTNNGFARITLLKEESIGGYPVITLNGSNPLDMKIGENYVEAGYSARDVNGQILTASISGYINTNVEGNYILAYSATDSSGKTTTKTRVINVYAGVIFHQETFQFTGGMQSFTIPRTGNYKMEVWGAQGGTWSNSCKTGSNANGGLGGYATGTKYFTKGEIIYIYVGAQGKYSTGGYNGGGSGGLGGGGGTDFRELSGDSKDSLSLQSRILVAGGGGGASYREQSNDYFCYQGLYVGCTDSRCATINSGGNFSGSNTGKFGVGTDSTVTSTIKFYSFSGAGGGGYYGGAGSNPRSGMGSGGAGSNYAASELTNKNLTNGDSSMPQWTGSGTMYGNTGNGYAKITLEN